MTVIAWLVIGGKAVYGAIFFGILLDALAAISIAEVRHRVEAGETRVKRIASHGMLITFLIFWAAGGVAILSHMVVNGVCGNGSCSQEWLIDIVASQPFIEKVLSYLGPEAGRSLALHFAVNLGLTLPILLAHALNSGPLLLTSGSVSRPPMRSAMLLLPTAFLFSWLGGYAAWDGMDPAGTTRRWNLNESPGAAILVHFGAVLLFTSFVPLQQAWLFLLTKRFPKEGV